MIVLKIIGIILAVVAVLILFIILIRVDIIIKAGSEDKFQLLVRVLGITFGKEKKNKKPKKQKPQKQKQQKTVKPKDNSILDRILGLFGLSHVGSGESIKESISDKGVLETVKDTADAVLIILQRLLKMLRRLKLRKLDLVFISGGDDAAKTAMDYGTACSILYPLLGYMQSAMKTNPKKTKIDIGCDFERERHYFKLDTVISLRVVHSVWALIMIVVKNVIKSVERGKNDG